jgi:hypothetical protein
MPSYWGQNQKKKNHKKSIFSRGMSFEGCSKELCRLQDTVLGHNRIVFTNSNQPQSAIRAEVLIASRTATGGDVGSVCVVQGRLLAGASVSFDPALVVVPA